MQAHERPAWCDEVLQQAVLLNDLATSQIEAWASGLAPLLATDDDVEAFALACQEAKTGEAAVLARALTTVAPASIAIRFSTAAENLVKVAAPLHKFGRSQLRSARSVTDRGGRSIVLGFGVGDEQDHSLLIEIDADTGVADLRVAGDPAQIIEAIEHDESATSRIVTEELSIEAAIDEVQQAWRYALDHPAPRSASVIANSWVASAWLATSTHGRLAALQSADTDTDPLRGLTEEEFARANKAARATLKSAVPESELQNLRSNSAENAWLAVVTAAVPGLATEEFDALLFLEWADWLGAGLGLWRAGVGADVSGASMVGFVNRCPEVSTTVDKADREYVEWAFGIAIEILTDAEVVDELGRLTSSGHAALMPALWHAWR